MAIFEDAIKIVLKHEGGYVDDPHDHGGATKYGISHRSYPEIDIKNLTLEKAKEIYKNDFWKTICGDTIKYQSIANKLLDISVNIGCKPAIKCLQKSIESIGVDYDLKIDGIMGNITLNFINICDENELLDEFKDQVADYYKSLNNSKYIKGWLNRVYDEE